MKRKYYALLHPNCHRLWDDRVFDSLDAARAEANHIDETTDFAPYVVELTIKG